jgi:hypothetical protein
MRSSGDQKTREHLIETHKAGLVYHRLIRSRSGTVSLRTNK